MFKARTGGATLNFSPTTTLKVDEVVDSVEEMGVDPCGSVPGDCLKLLSKCRSGYISQSRKGRLSFNYSSFFLKSM